MKLNDIKDKIEKSIIAVATCDVKGNPHNIAIAFAKVREDKIIITDNYMQKTKGNIKVNSKIALVFGRIGRGLELRGMQNILILVNG